MILKPFISVFDKKLLLVISLLIFSITGYSQAGCLTRVEDSASNLSGYKAANGKIEVAFGKYSYCFTEKFCRFAIVSTDDGRIIGINRKQEILFDVFRFDNGPDPVSDGLFRIMKKGKIGFADIHGNIIIQPIYDCAEPFSMGKARVGKGCKYETDGEHSRWVGGEWFTINKKGKRVGKLKGNN